MIPSSDFEKTCSLLLLIYLILKFCLTDLFQLLIWEMQCEDFCHIDNHACWSCLSLLKAVKLPLNQFEILTLYRAAMNLVSQWIDQMLVFPRSITSATIVPCAVPSRHIHAVRESSAGYVFSVIAWRNGSKHFIVCKYTQ